MTAQEITVIILGSCRPVHSDRTAMLAQAWFQVHGEWALTLPQSQWEVLCRVAETATSWVDYNKELSDYLARAAERDQAAAKWGNQQRRDALLTAVRTSAGLDGSLAAEAFRARLADLPENLQNELTGKVNYALAREFISAIVGRIRLELKKRESP